MTDIAEADTAAPQTDAAPPPPTNEMPQVTPAAERPKRFVGIFNPESVKFPTHEDLVGVLTVLGIQTRLIAGEDQPGGNLLDEGGNVVIPSHLRPFFKMAEVAPQS